jgi:cytochrome P450
VTPTNDEWRKHRKVAGPAFGTKFDEAMWNQTVRYVDESIGRIEARNEPKGQRVINVFEEVMRTTLLIIFAAGFGVDVPWPENAEAPVAPHTLTFLDASEQQFAALVPKGFMPKVCFFSEHEPVFLSTSL